MRAKLVYGIFDSESLWREKNIASLPAIKSYSADYVKHMDELLFVFCNRDDKLFTRRKMNLAHIHYLRSIGFSFENIAASPRHDEESLENMLIKENVYINVSEITPYSILDNTSQVEKKYTLKNVLPSYEAAVRVNSKLFSYEISKQWDANYKGVLCYSADQLLTISQDSLSNGIIIKDFFGVSGKGNLVVHSKGILESVFRHIKKQEDRGMATQLIVEPFLQKETDFSCHLSIDVNGEPEILSVQYIDNNGLSYKGSRHVHNSSFIDKLDAAGYFDTVFHACKSIYKHGYHGEVCIDSMILADGSIYPVVEINARKSMGLINTKLDHYLTQHGYSSYLTFLDLQWNAHFTYEQFLEVLHRNKLLFSPNERGVIPLTSNTVMSNGSSGKGRLYLSIPYQPNESPEYLSDIKVLMNEMNIKTY
ncbi:hypothetical protein [Paenibacillus pseudetheri]|uniref:ATP-grasp domain-containing protein n=1 Tax=Paenibacillus pseudetheri TaxID=2897682 RepID=A0ABM9BIY5_9BACL|nr:hypothetical protein [Paenibacillus pseudetheri]CAH1058984.1 hypothetical protein PAECIP111894_05170 [Paenibacillus pseudetheri]